MVLTLAKLKEYLIEILLKRAGPVAAGALVSALMALGAAHQGLLEQFGITFGTWPLTWPTGQAPSGHVLLIELDTLSQAAIVALVALYTAGSAIAAHHAGQSLTPKESAPPEGAEPV